MIEFYRFDRNTSVVFPICAEYMPHAICGDDVFIVAFLLWTWSWRIRRRTWR